MTTKLKDNGIHEFAETGKWLVFRNHSEKRWWAMDRRGGIFNLLGQSKKRASRRGVNNDASVSIRTFATAEKAIEFARKATA